MCLKYPYFEMERDDRGGFRPVPQQDDNEYRIIYCCLCERDTHARLTTGAEVYRHRPDLADLPFWKCDRCGNHVGCHHKTKDRTRPLGVIPTKEITNARQHIHRILDPLWQSGSGNKEQKKKRKKVYALISEKLGYEYHTAEIRSVEEARKIYTIITEIKKQWTRQNQKKN